ncbi:MAG: hypothetical protein JW910_06790 [Anaerolineae bacterium]|nr:hypothetical protein [Anaerolineae bacterium]
MTLHDIVRLRHGEIVRRCSTCSYTAIEPPPEHEHAEQIAGDAPEPNAA